MKNVFCALTIAGTDPTGGAGIQADLKTFQELKSYGMSVVTSAVAQNTTGVQSVHHLPIDFIDEQLESVFTDMPVHAVKTGMIATIEMMEVIYEKLSRSPIPYVMDPVMVATSGDVLIEVQARDYLRDYLLPLTEVVTPNIPEAEFLTGLKIESFDDMKKAAQTIVEDFGAKAALVKGGHLNEEATDILYDGAGFHHFTSERIQTTSTHGTGCTYSAALTAHLSQGHSLVDAVNRSKKFVTAALKHAHPLGSGHGPTNHWGLREEQQEIKS
ncbi:bifunctional hydroxymethylpyrimidine kinase/phosphomethylpyrimidine kinase [Tenuibacillus multivorans]|uniref:Hydroxymethylpyrimidine/phosphomethylpyrimidine kinase n=1 Tax=Tenuibacillus multivorans TaxID=237069 RepID=A0A1H0G1M1_9BACI|nr:bifunctional hydroxymethylpyrimidine kinase/phosphomethylpyrimidine kinase [Tenuibacillus multivorans]GEL78120.1 hydroxymethylpyrimidine/phosphomethylpyrimidine kinase [Tenuibacillus multivorans]SDO00741.1 hydroxymethylpyrimidine/phosphomethylpyrimidine kinase [Tenuibacillus multivorans]